MKRFVLHIFKYGLLVFIFLNVISWCSLFFLRNSSFYKPQFLSYEVKKATFDYIVIGSSIGLTTLDTALIDSLTNKKGINLSIDDTAISSNYLMLQHFFKQGKKTQFCILAISNWDLANKNPVLNNNDYRFLPFVSQDYVYNYYKNLEQGFFKPLTFSHYFPLFGVSYYNTEIFYPSLISALKPNKHNRFDQNGNYSYPDIGTIQPKKWSSIKLSWNNPFVEKIKKLCEINNTILVIYQAPIFKTKIVTNNLNYNFINNANVIKNDNYFFDDIHLNMYGRKEASTIFAKELLTNYIKK
ncbi:hypothetical protein OX283_007000 [Flavobacterium sp. SUN052]|uniref:hypothetical protein n=1 Tax=Flavobacterium sp. SUN052 TaxID=3002441 RepID=UPI00237DFF53|nr:hypothetical protein [Flavobacterium sp. SUN052]MEC4004397.1 hypothetical protein [Flavobacterium sp. SUN052]